MTRISAYDFGAKGKDGAVVANSGEAKKIILDRLLQLVADIDAGNVSVLSVETSSELKVNSFATSTLTLRLLERQ